MYVNRQHCVRLCMNADALISPDGSEKEVYLQYDVRVIGRLGEHAADYDA